MDFRTLQTSVLALLVSFASSAAGADLWQIVDTDSAGIQQRAAASNGGSRLYRADIPALRAALADAPAETAGRRDYRLQLPMPDGRLESFVIAESPILAPVLAARYPQIKSYRVFATADGEASGRISMTPRGLQAMIFTPEGRVFVTSADPASSDPVYRSTFTGDAEPQAFTCGVDGHSRDLSEWVTPPSNRASRVAGNLLRYRVAIAATFEYYTLTGGGTDPGTTSEILAALSAVNAIYERDLGITLQLVANNDLLYESIDGGLLANEDSFKLLDQVNRWIDNRIGDGAYDIGHIFAQPASGSEGVANLGAVCDSAIKAGGVSASSTPLGSAFYIDLVAHEIGHQFNAEHSFNGTAGACGENRSRDSAVEPGSGSTVMSYAGICGAENLQNRSDATFHARSIAQIDAFTKAGGNCSSLDTNGNTDPTVGAIANKSIPALTPFVLDANASDADSDPLDYQWDQMDAGCPTDSNSFGTDIGNNALFRSYAPRSESQRHFPALGTQVNGRYDKAEVMACHDRALDFRVTVRDGNSGQATGDVRVTVDASSGPFKVTGPNTGPIFAGSALTVTWDPAGTNLSPVNCAEVDIDLLAFNATYDSYTAYPLATGVTNSTGNASMNVLNAVDTHPRTRFRVKCSDNIFYDISDSDLELLPTIGSGVLLDDSANLVRQWANPAITSFTAPACGAVASCPEPSTGDTSGGKGDSSAVDIRWLALLVLAVGLVKLGRRYGLQ